MCRCILWIGGSNWRKRLASEVTFFMVFLHFEKIPCVPFCDYVVQVQVVCFCSCLRHFVEVSCGWSDVVFPRGENIVEATVLIVYPFEATGKRLYVGAFGWKAWLPKVTLSKTTNKNQEDFKKMDIVNQWNLCWMTSKIILTGPARNRHSIIKCGPIIGPGDRPARIWWTGSKHVKTL